MSFHPQTPQSPSQLSPTTASDPRPLSGASSASVTAAPAVSTVGSSSGSSSSSSHIGAHGGSGGSGTSSSSFSFSSTATPSTLPTPAHSVTGSGFGASDAAHDLADPAAADDSPHAAHKRKRPRDDASGDHDLAHDPKKIHMEGQQRLDFEALHQDVGEKYLVCKTPHRPSFPPLSADLFSMFDLTGIAAEVARTLPNGEKNAMRKTYKGYMKKLGVSGHFEPVKREEGDDGDFLLLVGEPEDVWQARQVKTKDLRYGLLDDVEADLRKALTMHRGPVPKAVFDSSVLGDLAPDKLVVLGAGAGSGRSSSVRGTTPSTPLHPAVARSKTQPPAAAASTSAGGAVGGADVARPRRANKKRSYGDNSFEGYGEGFPDDDLGDAGYSTGEGEGPSHKRRKKNDTPTAQYPAAPVRQQSYGPGMVGA